MFIYSFLLLITRGRALAHAPRWATFTTLAGLAALPQANPASVENIAFVIREKKCVILPRIIYIYIFGAF